MKRTSLVAIGLVIQAVAAFLTLALFGRLVGPAAFAEISALYVLATAVATGLFAPLEQEIARRRGAEYATENFDSTLLRRTASFGALVCAIVALVATAVYFTVYQNLSFLAAFCVTIAGYAAIFISRGFLAAEGRWGRYGIQVAVEGVFRLAGALVLLLLGSQSVGACEWLIATAPWIAFGISIAGLRPRPTPPRLSLARPNPIVGPLLLLLASALAGQAIIGATPAVAKFFAHPEDLARVGTFIAVLVVVRVPILLFTAVQSGMLVVLSGHAAAGRLTEFKALLARILALMTGLAVTSTLGAALIGPHVMTILFGPGYLAPASTFLLTGLAIGPYLLSGILGQAVLALGQHRLFAFAWLTGPVSMCVGLLMSPDAVHRAIFGLLLGALTVASTLGAVLWHGLRRLETSWKRETPAAPTAVLAGAAD